MTKYNEKTERLGMKSFSLALSAVMALTVNAAHFTVTIETGDARSVQEADYPERDGKVRFTWPRAKLPPNVKRVIVTPDFAAARKGEAGCWVLPDNTYGTFREDSGKLFLGWSVYMPMFGLVTPRRTYCAIVTGMPFALGVEIVVEEGRYRQSAVFFRDMDDVYEDLAIEYRFLDGDDANASGIGRCYRAYQLKRGACRPITERLKDQPLLEYAVRNPEVRIRQAWKPVPSPVAEQVTRNEPPVKPVVTFDRFRDIVDECVRQGVKGAEFCLVGWNIGGHDGRYPEIFPVEPSLGGEAKLKAAVRHAQEKGYQVVGHSSFRDCYMIANTWDAEYVIEKNPDGTLRRGETTWGGGRLYTMCPRRAYERFCPKQCAEMATLGFKGLFYLDVATIGMLVPCRDPRHPLNPSQRAVWEGAILEEVRRTFGGSASEGARDFCIGALDSALTIQWTKPFEKPANGLIDGYFPLWQIVYHGIVLSTPFRTMINCPANPDRRFTLKLAEFGGRPTFYWHSCFVTGRPPSMGTWDLEATTDEKLRQSVAWMKEGADEYARRSDLQFAFMDRHEKVAEDVFRVTYSNGAALYVNYGAADVTVDGVRVPSLGTIVRR